MGGWLRGQHDEGMRCVRYRDEGFRMFKRGIDRNDGLERAEVGLTGGNLGLGTEGLSELSMGQESEGMWS